MNESPMAADPFRVLALDGGGIKGTYTASVLAELERMSGKKVAEHFDLITGTSTGGIIAIALGLGIGPERIRQLYIEEGPSIFPSSPATGLLQFFRRKHDARVLKGALQAVFGERTLGNSAVRLVVPAFDAQRGNVQLFKTAHAPEYKQDYRLRATDVALSTAAAPTYFSAHRTTDGACFVDGGVWANCPSLVGILESICILKKPLDSVHVLSIGTTTEPYFIDQVRRDAGKIPWAQHAPELFMQAQVQSTLGQSRLMLGEQRFLRVDETVAPGRFRLDKATDVMELRALGEQAARCHEARIASTFLYEPAQRFTPCYGA